MQRYFNASSPWSRRDKKGKRKKEDDTSLNKKTERKAKQCYHNDTCRWKRDSLSSEVKIARRIVWVKILKNRILKKF